MPGFVPGIFVWGGKTALGWRHTPCNVEKST